MAMPTSTPGNGTPISPRNPPNAITIGNVTGNSHMAGAPSCAPQRPTETIARIWSSPEIGCLKPERNPPASPATICALAGPDSEHASASVSRHVSEANVARHEISFVCRGTDVMGRSPLRHSELSGFDRSSETRSRSGRGRFWPRRRRSARAPVPPRERRSGDGPRSGGALLPLSRRRRRPAPDRHVNERRRAPAIELEPGPEHRLDQHQRERQLAVFGSLIPERVAKEMQTVIRLEVTSEIVRPGAGSDGMIPLSCAWVSAPST